MNMREIISEEEAVSSLICLCWELLGHNEIVSTGIGVPMLTREHYDEIETLIYGPLRKHKALLSLINKDEPKVKP